MSPAICVARRTLVSVALHFAIAAAALLVMTCSPPVAAAPSFSPLVWLSPAFWHVTPPPYAVEPVRIDSLGDGRHFALHLSGRPPENFRMPAVSPAQVGPMAGTKILDGVPGMDWCYGCLPTATAIIMGYYDRRAYPNLYTGPSALGAGVKPMTVDGGVFPLNNSQWGIKECPLAATHMGIDGRTIRGYVDDYYYGYMSEREDPYITNKWTQHKWVDCTGDFMGSSQSRHGNIDGNTQTVFDNMGWKVRNYDDREPDFIDGAMGWQRFINSRGYAVEDCYTQLIEGKGLVTGFTWDDYVAEIDAGRPVILLVGPHSLVGFGYRSSGQVCYVRDTWDYNMHELPWGGQYTGYDHEAVMVLKMASTSKPTMTWTGAEGYTGDGIEPNVAPPGSSFTFRVKYIHPQGTAPNYMRLLVYGPDGQPIEGSPFAMTRLSNTYTTGAEWKLTKTFATRGAYTYAFTCVVGSTLYRLPASGGLPGPLVDQAPTLTWLGTSGYASDGVHPQNGAGGKSYVYKIRYADADGDPAAWVRLKAWGPEMYPLAGSPFAMQSAAGTPNWTAGVEFSRAVTLMDAGVHGYAFEASDGIATVTQPVDNGYLGGPTVYSPVLSWPGTTNYTSDGVHADWGVPKSNFFFKVKYAHPVGAAATSVQVHVYKPNGTEMVGSPFEMARAAGTPDWVNGVIFTRRVNLPGHGWYSYRFTATEGGTPVNYPEGAAKEGPVTDTPPDFAWVGSAGYVSDGVHPNTGAPGTTFVFRGRYSDVEGDPGEMQVRVWLPNGTQMPGSPFDLTPAEGTPDWVAGVNFVLPLALTTPGTYKYQFLASDGFLTRQAPSSPLDGPTVSGSGDSLAILTGVAAQQVASGATLTFTLSAPAEVRVTVLNMAGRLVAEVPAGAREAGVCTLHWNGRNAAGSPVPAGLYLLRLEARTSSGTLSQAVAPLSLRR